MVISFFVFSILGLIAIIGLKLSEIKIGRRHFFLFFLSSKDRHIKERIIYLVKYLRIKKDQSIREIKIKAPIIAKRIFTYLNDKIMKLISRFSVYKRGKSIIQDKGAVSFFLRHVSQSLSVADTVTPSESVEQEQPLVLGVETLALSKVPIAVEEEIILPKKRVRARKVIDIVPTTTI